MTCGIETTLGLFIGILLGLLVSSLCVIAKARGVKDEDAD